MLFNTLAFRSLKGMYYPNPEHQAGSVVNRHFVIGVVPAVT